MRGRDTAPKANRKKQQALGLPVGKAFENLGKILELERQFSSIIRNATKIAAKHFTIFMSLNSVVTSRDHKHFRGTRSIQFVENALHRSQKELGLPRGKAKCF